jgi:hypothetical protein
VGAALAFLLALATGPASGFEVVSTHPARNELDVDPVVGTIWTVFDQAPALPGAGAVRVSGVMSGLHDVSLETTGDTLKVHLGPKPLLIGEIVNVDLRRDIETAAGGATLSGGYHFAFTVATGTGALLWSERAGYPASRIPYFIHGGDLDNDGHPDLAVPNEETNDVSIFLNDGGSGVFDARSDYGVGTKPSSIFGEDLNNDGFQDLVTANIIAGTISVLINNGDGSFAPAVSYPAGGLNTACRQVDGGDFDGDGDVDLCATSHGTDRIYLYTNQGDGTFAPGVPYLDVAAGPFAIDAADLDNDGHVDIAVACQTDDALTVLRNDGTGQFSTLGVFALGDGPWDLVGNDFDGDGDVDLLAAASFENRIVVLVNDGTGGFPVRHPLSTGAFPLAVHAADLDGDGDIDATSSNFSGGTVNVFVNPGDGVLALQATLEMASAGSYAWASDLDGDGDLDLSVVDELADSVYVFYDGSSPTGYPGEPGESVDAGPGLEVVPNPAISGVGAALHLRNVTGEVAVRIVGVDGRTVREIAPGLVGGADPVVRWDGRDANGRAVPSGRYFIRVLGRDGLTVAGDVLAIR